MKFSEDRPLYKLMEIASILRGENGCPWDKKQTSRTLKPYLIEEAYEVYDAIAGGNPDDLREELGDLLFQVYLHSQIASEENLFTIDDVAGEIAEKLIRRHPHVFGDETIKDSEGVIQNWEKIKLREKSHRTSMLDGVPRHLPALLMAYRVQQKVSRVGFDWEKIDDAMTKLDEELTELREVVESDDTEKIIDEAGDIMFSIVNVLRFRGINPEIALRRTIDKFVDRFKTIEKMASEKGKRIDEMGPAELDSLWEESKKRA